MRELGDWAVTGTPGSSGAPSQNSTPHPAAAHDHNGQRPRIRSQAQMSRHTWVCTRPAWALNPATGASGLPRNHLLAPPAGVGFCRPPSARQNANSCEDGVRRVGNFLHGKHCLLVLCACVRTRRGRPGVTTTAGSHTRPPVWNPTGDVVAERCPGGVDRSQGGEDSSAVLTDRVRCVPGIRGHVRSPGRVAAFAAPRVPAAARGRTVRTTPRRQADRAGGPDTASIRGPDMQCQ